MRKAIIALSLFASATASADICTDSASCSEVAEETDEVADTPEFDKLRTPDSPAFSILGVSPSDVERPNSPRALVLSLGAFASESGTDLIVPDSFALEVNPYSMVVKDPSFESEGGFNPLAFGKNLTISVGTANEDVTDPMTMEQSSLPTKLAVGLRTRLFNADPREEKCNAVFKPLLDLMTPLTKEEIEEIRKLPDGDEPAAYKAKRKEKQDIIDKLDAATMAKIAALKPGECLQTRDAKLGWSVDVAFATSAHFADGKLQWVGGHHHSATAGWLSGAYQGKQGSIVVLGRWTMEDTLDAMETDGYKRRQFLDAGLRAIYAKDKYGASVEGVARFRVKGDPYEDEDSAYFRFAVLADYKVSSTQWLNVTFGKNFGRSAEASDIFTLANLKWSFDSERSVVKKEKEKDAAAAAAGDDDDDDEAVDAHQENGGTPAGTQTTPPPTAPEPTPPPPPPAPAPNP